MDVEVRGLCWGSFVTLECAAMLGDAVINTVQSFVWAAQPTVSWLNYVPHSYTVFILLMAVPIKRRWPYVPQSPRSFYTKSSYLWQLKNIYLDNVNLTKLSLFHIAYLWIVGSLMFDELKRRGIKRLWPNWKCHPDVYMENVQFLGYGCMWCHISEACVLDIFCPISRPKLQTDWLTN